MVDKQKKLIALLPPKTASNSFQNYLFSLGYKWSTPSIKLNHPEIHLTLKEYCLKYNINHSHLNEYQIIQIVRNPLDRFISSFHHQQILLNWANSNINISKKPYKDLCYLEGNWGGLRFYYPQTLWNDLNQNIEYFKLEEITDKDNNFFNQKNQIFPKLNISPLYNKTIPYSLKTHIYNLFKPDFKVLNYEF